MQPLAWGRRVAPAFRARVREIVTPAWGGVTPDDLMACMAFESAGTFSPAVRNKVSGATGLIQFMPQTAGLLGTSTAALARMTAVGQLDYVARYFAPFRSRLRNLGDLYCAILWPAGIGKADSAVLFRRGDPDRPKLYLQNAGLDADRDGDIERGEVTACVRAKLVEGRQADNAG